MNKDEALRLALDALYGFIPYLPLEHDKPQCDRYDKAITAIKAALEAKDEPVTYDKTELNSFVQGLYDKKMQEGKHGHFETMFYCVHQAIKRVSPPQRTWVGLTDEEIAQMGLNNYRQVVRETEAALKAKNT